MLIALCGAIIGFIILVASLFSIFYGLRWLFLKPRRGATLLLAGLAMVAFILGIPLALYFEEKSSVDRKFDTLDQSLETKLNKLFGK